jgi:hypothetical protein
VTAARAACGARCCRAAGDVGVHPPGALHGAQRGPCHAARTVCVRLVCALCALLMLPRARGVHRMCDGTAHGTAASTHCWDPPAIEVYALAEVPKPKLLHVPVQLPSRAAAHAGAPRTKHPPPPTRSRGRCAGTHTRPVLGRRQARRQRPSGACALCVRVRTRMCTLGLRWGSTKQAAGSHPHAWARLRSSRCGRCRAWESASASQLVLLPMLPYLAWSVGYYVKIFHISAEKIRCDAAVGRHVLAVALRCAHTRASARGHDDTQTMACACACVCAVCAATTPWGGTTPASGRAAT